MEQIASVIRGLKQEIGRMKNLMEHPEYRGTLDPSEDARIYWNREYLKSARLALADAGGICAFSKAEEKAADFDKNMNAISTITLTFRDSFNPDSQYVINLTEDVDVHKESWPAEEPLVSGVSSRGVSCRRETFLSALGDLHIGEWRASYSIERFGYMVLDGTKWELLFQFQNGHKPLKFRGDNAAPYNFDQFLLLIGIEKTEEA